MPPPPSPQQVFFSFSWEREELLNKIFSCGLVLGTSVHENNFQIGTTVLAQKLDKGRLLGGHTIKDNVTVTSSNFSLNDRTDKDFDPFLPKTTVKYCSVVSITSVHLICAFQVINIRIITLFHHFFLQFLHITKIGQTPQLQYPIFRAFHSY